MPTVLLQIKNLFSKILGPFDIVKVLESPKYTKQRFCPAELNHNANGF
jgi:hypothetical protein